MPVEIDNLCGKLLFHGQDDIAWWADPGWIPDAHQEALSLPSSARQGKEK